jgi:hypothetical protein
VEYIKVKTMLINYTIHDFYLQFVPGFLLNGRIKELLANFGV